MHLKSHSSHPKSFSSNSVSFPQNLQSFRKGSLIVSTATVDINKLFVFGPENAISTHSPTSTFHHTPRVAMGGHCRYSFSKNLFTSRLRKSSNACCSRAHSALHGVCLYWCHSFFRANL